jgi:hypothetical protein
MKKLLLTFLATAAMALSAHAQTVTFTFGSIGGGGQAALDLDDKASGSTTMGGLTLTATASSGLFNSTANDGFGINAAPDR